MSRVHRTQSVSAVSCPFFYHFPSVTAVHHYKSRVAYTRKINMFSNKTCLNGTYLCFIFQHIVQIYLNKPIKPYERLHCCDRCISHRNNTLTRSLSSMTLSCQRANFLHQTYIAGLVKHSSPHTGRISEWMTFGQVILSAENK